MVNVARDYTDGTIQCVIKERRLCDRCQNMINEGKASIKAETRVNAIKVF